MRRLQRYLIPFSAVAALTCAGCDASLDSAESTFAEPDAGAAALEGSTLSREVPFEAVYEFQGTWEPGIGFHFEPAVLQTGELRTAEQAQWCGMTVVADGIAGAGPANTLEVVGEPGTILQNEACFPGGVYPAPAIVYLASRALCQDVTVRSFFDAGTLANVHAVIDFVSVPGYEAYNVPGVTGAPSPGGDNLPSIVRGLWSYGDLGHRTSGSNAATQRWIFRYPQEQAFAFNGRLLASFVENCSNAVDDDCDGRVNEGCQTFADGAVCASNLDCASLNCDPGTSRCAASTCGDGQLNGTETAIDCGGLCTTKCANGATCSVAGDCTSGICRSGTCRASAPPTAGQVIVSEVMAFPAADGAAGEWIELTNLTPTGLDLTGCELSDADVDLHAIASPLTLGANGRLVLGGSADVATNGGVTVDYAWTSGFRLANSGDLVRLTCDGVLIDSFVVPVSAAGRAVQLASWAQTAQGNDLAANLCRATSAYGSGGNFGTPGAANSSCGLAPVAAGTFTVGSPVTEAARFSNEAQQSVTLTRSLLVQETEVTQGQWKALSGGTNPSYIQNTTCTGAGCSSTENANDSGPVERVDWYAALGYANALSIANGLNACYTLVGCTDPVNGWRDGVHDGCTDATLAGLSCNGYRLPTEAEWEVLARAGTTTASWLGDWVTQLPSGDVELCATCTPRPLLSSIAFFNISAGGRTRAVGSLPANPLGLYDMLGNVNEWTNDRYATPLPSGVDPVGPTTGATRTFRGGGWSNAAATVRAAFRADGNPNNRDNNIGFRLVRSRDNLSCGALSVTNGSVATPGGDTSGATATYTCAAGYALTGSAIRTCQPSGVWSGTAPTCVEVDECAAGTACTSPNSRCENTPGSWRCSCQNGYVGAVTQGANSTCTLRGAGDLGAACTADTDCDAGLWCPTNTAHRYCAPRPLLGGTVAMPYQYIPAGTFTMGSPVTEVGRLTNEPQREVTITRPFMMQTTEVTQAQWEAVSGGINPTCDGPAGACAPANDNPLAPVVNVDWYSALAFANALSVAEGLSPCYRLEGCFDATSGWKDGNHNSCTYASFAGLSCSGYRLPTEAEWEYAARAGTTTATYAGNLNVGVTDCTTTQPNLDPYGWWCRNTGGQLQPAGTRLPNPWGLYDVLGNAAEIVWDVAASYPPGPAVDPLGAEWGNSIGLRGGSWLDVARLGRAAYRGANGRVNYYSAQGLRLARSIDNLEVDECATGAACTAAGNRCENTPGSWRCWCNDGYAGAMTEGADATCTLRTAGAMGAACTSDAQCDVGLWCPTNTSLRFCAPRLNLGGATMPFQYIAAGTFVMGSPPSEGTRGLDENQFPVTVSRPYAMQTTEVTQGQWKALSGGANPSCFQTTTGTACTGLNSNDQGPVERLDWYSMLAYANALSVAEGLSACYTLVGCADPTNGWKDGIHTGCTDALFAGLSCTGYRLPTEAEWERAARAGTTATTWLGNWAAQLPSGDVQLLCPSCANPYPLLSSISWFQFNSGNRSQIVATTPPNPWGLYDMLGNVLEWCWDRYGTYPGAAAVDPLGAGSGANRAFRGGLWYAGDAVQRAAERASSVPSDRNGGFGFRLVRTIP